MKRRSTFRRISLAVILLVFVAGALYPPTSHIFRNTASVTAQWVLKPFHFFGTILNKGWKNAGGYLSAYRENRDLLNTQALLVADKTRMLILERENQDLRKALGLRDETKRDVFYGDVIGSFAEGRDEYLIVSRDRNRSLPEGAAALSPGGILLGFVRIISDNAATIRLIASPSESISVRILPSGVDGIMRGDNSGEYLISLVPSAAEVNAGDVVVTAGRNLGVPSAVPVGFVANVERRPTETFLWIRVKSPVEANFLDKIFILAD